MSKIWFSLIAAVLFFSCCQKEANIRSDQLYEEAKREKNLTKAKLFLEQSSDEENLGRANLLVGYLLKNEKNYDSALLYFQKALPFYTKFQNSLFITKTYRFIGNIHKESGNFKTAIRLYDLALSHASAEEQQIININKAKCLRELDMWKEADELVVACLSYFFGSNNYMLAEGYLTRGNIRFDYYFSSKNVAALDQAIGYYYRALDLYEDPQLKAKALNNIGNVYLELGKLDRARIYLDSALSIHSDEQEILTTNYNLGRWHAKMGETDSALVHFKRSIIPTDYLTHEMRLSYEHIIKTYIGQNRFDSTLAFFDAYNQRVESELDRRKKLKNQTAELLWENHTLSQSLDNQEKQHTKRLLTLALWIAVPALLITLIIWLAFKRLRRKIRKVIAS